MSSIEIRNATIEDAPELLSILTYYIKNTTASFEINVPTLEEKLRDWFPRNPKTLIVATISKKIIGFAMLNKYRQQSGYDLTREVSVWVNCNNLGVGVGDLLLKQLVVNAKEEGCLCLVAVLCKTNVKSERLFLRNNFYKAAEVDKIAVKFGRELGILIYQLVID